MGISGNISTMSLAEVFQWLHNGLKTGTLHIKGNQRTVKEVYFKDGLISSASSNDPSELIGQFLLATNRITESQLMQALDAQNQDHVLLGKILVQQKVVSQEELDKILRTISEEIIYEMFLWKEGNFEFMDDVLPRREIPMLALDITHLVLEGAQREDEWSRIHDVFPDEHVVVRPKIDTILERLPLAAETTKLLTLVNGNRSIYEILRLAKTTKYQLLRTLLDLHEEQLIEVQDYRTQIIPPQIQLRKNPVKEMLVSVESMMKQGKLAEAERGLIKLEQIASNHPDVKKLRELIHEKRLETTAKEMINPSAIPVLQKDISELTRMEMSAEQGFLISRINGVWDVKSILKVAPFEEMACLKIFKKFLDDGVITLK